jgi:hypothetical protein
MNKLEYMFAVIRLVECVVGLMLHGIGMFSIILHTKKSTQTLSLFSLSVVEVLYLIMQGALDTVTILNQQNWLKLFTSFQFTIHRFIWCTAMFEFLFIMIILTGDRLVCIINPLKHNIYLPRNRMKKVIFLSWIISIVLGVIDATVHGTYIVVISLIIVVGSLYFILVIITYTIIIIKVRKSRRRFRTANTNQPNEGINFRKEFLIPTLIIFSSVLLYTFPFLFQRVIKNKNEDMQFIINNICEVLQLFGLIVDPFIYVFLTKHYREIIVTKCFPCTCIFQRPAPNINNDIPLQQVHSLDATASNTNNDIRLEHVHSVDAPGFIPQDANGTPEGSSTQ